MTTAVLLVSSPGGEGVWWRRNDSKTRKETPEFDTSLEVAG